MPSAQASNPQAGNNTMAVNFEDANDDDPVDLMGKLHQIQYTYDGTDIVKWLNRLELKMESYAVNSQWSKRIVIGNNLPDKIQDEIPLLNKRKAEAGNTIYKDIKMALLKLHGPKPDADYRTALNLVMTDTPSHCAKRLRDLICKKKDQLTTCCCDVMVEAHWRDALPGPVRTAVAGMSLKKEKDFKAAIAHADEVFEAMKNPNGSKVAAMQVAKPKQSYDGAGAFAGYDDGTSQDEIAAMRQQQGRGGRGRPYRGRGQGQRGRGGAAGGQGGRGGRQRPPPPNPTDPSTWGSPHEDGPPSGACMNHYRHGRGAYYCRAKSSCPWRHIESPPADDRA